MIAWTIAVAKACPEIDRVIVSTDDKEIAEVAASFGAEVPFLRPQLLAGDEAPMLSVVRHVVDEIPVPDDALIVLLQPTSPFRTAADLEAAIGLLFASGARSLVSIVRTETHPHWALKTDPHGRIAPFLSGVDKGTRRQDLESAFRPNGAIYLARAGAIREGEGWHGVDTIGYEMPRERSLDIDDPWDLEIARAIVHSRTPKICPDMSKP